ncbi:LuxR family transcriptional regulator [Corynebacterium phocae]|uniref:LuxR family transcriptional regulator n=1 Tax=Corynebacterium phocae TaxID=161895 RepID=A0A1L7D5S2_9CORY|nr:response regulator transcription factor [Corynebacterium phocae]APT93488.1 LuxR family transcriptional regulator [Corynebacterium phocae]KAA8720567.1 response regulator transcription factor [Corynebacterium phocae]
MISVMLIDDHPVVRAGLKAILDSFEGIGVVAEGNSGAAVEDMPEVDVVVCDISMPGVDGIEATRRLKAAGGPPVLILTTYDSETDIMAALEAGALGYLLKDAPEEQLRQAVKDTAAGKRTLAPEVAVTLAERVTKPRESLSAREREILSGLATGASNRELATQFFVSEATIKTHLVHIYQKLGVDNRTAAVTVARERKLL